VRILLDERKNVLTVARGGYVDQNGGRFIYVVHDNIAERRAIRLGAVGIDKVEILEGLEVGDQVVVSGSDAFDNAERVVIAR
jgi:HlyD family secretion protein